MACCYFNTNVNTVILQKLYHIYHTKLYKNLKIYRFLLLRLMIVCSPKFLTMKFHPLSMHTKSFLVVSKKSFLGGFALLWFLRHQVKVDQCETNSETIFYEIRAV